MKTWISTFFFSCSISRDSFAMSLVLEMDVLGHFVSDTIFADIFSWFLSLGDVCWSDSAIYCKNRRPLFLNCTKSFIFLGDKGENFGSLAILWLQRRSIKIRHLKCGTINDDTAMIISSFGSCLHWLSLECRDGYHCRITDMGIFKLEEKMCWILLLKYFIESVCHWHRYSEVGRNVSSII